MMDERRKPRWLPRFGWLVFGLVLLSVCCPTSHGQEMSFRIRIPLPINDASLKSVQTDLRTLQERVAAADSESTAVVLEFDTADNVTGEGSSFEASFAMARALQRPELRQIRKIAYIPPPAGFTASAIRELNVKATSRLSGHAILVALACDELWMDQKASLARVTAQDDLELILPNYTTIARRGIQWPPAMVQVLVDGQQGLYRVTKTDGAKVFVDQEERETLNEANQEVSSEELVSPGAPQDWNADTLASWGLIQPVVQGREDLLNRTPGKQLVNLSVAAGRQEWKAAHLRVTHLDSSFVRWTSRSIHSEILIDDTNLLFLTIETLGAADFESAADFADMLVNLDRDSVYLVALLPTGASGPETMVALACDEIVMADDQLIGGRQSLPLSDDGLLERLDSQMRLIANAAGRDWSLVAGLALGNVTLHEYRNRKTGGSRLLSEEQWKELPDQQDWQDQGPVQVSNGLSAKQALDRGIVNHVVSDMSSASELYDIEEWTEVVPTFADRGVQRLADFLNHPAVSALLLFVGMFALFSELSAPGLGVPGFVATCCLSLFFWSHFMDGSADVLEIVLFALGVIFVLLELFVIPGFGIFGLGGGLMILASLILASQDFVIPRSREQVNQMALSVMTLISGMIGVLAAILFVRYYLDQIPFLNRLVLEPPGSEMPDDLAGEANPAGLGYLLNRNGVAMTTLRPSGKAKFGNEIVDVITDGRLMDRDSPVRVYEVQGTVVKVEPTDV